MSKKVRGAIFILICGLFLFQAVNRGARRLAAPSKPAAPAAAAAHPKAVTAANTPIIHASFHPLRYSLLRGGFNSVDEFFERVNEDPVLHDFYGDCADRNASLHKLPEDIVTFSTFRRGNEIKWAAKPVVVKKGEYVMNFCGKTVLARCGNLVSVSPMQPSEDIPPALLEDPEVAPAAPLTLAASGEAPAAPAALPPPAGGAPVTPAVVAAAAHHPFWFIPPFYVPPGHGGHGGPTLPTPAGPPIITPGSPSAPPPGGPLSGDEFDGHTAYITLFIGMFVIGILKLTTR